MKNFDCSQQPYNQQQVMQPDNSLNSEQILLFSNFINNNCIFNNTPNNIFSSVNKQDSQNFNIYPIETVDTIIQSNSDEDILSQNSQSSCDEDDINNEILQLSQPKKVIILQKPQTLIEDQDCQNSNFQKQIVEVQPKKQVFTPNKAFKKVKPAQEPSNLNIQPQEIILINSQNDQLNQIQNNNKNNNEELQKQQQNIQEEQEQNNNNKQKSNSDICSPKMRQKRKRSLRMKKPKRVSVKWTPQKYDKYDEYIKKICGSCIEITHSQNYSSQKKFQKTLITFSLDLSYMTIYNKKKNSLKKIPTESISYSASIENSYLKLDCQDCYGNLLEFEFNYVQCKEQLSQFVSAFDMIQQKYFLRQEFYN